MTTKGEQKTKRIYTIARIELRNGDRSVTEMRERIKDFEAEQKYEECAGMQQAIDEFLKGK